MSSLPPQNKLVLAYDYLKEADQLNSDGKYQEALACLQQAFDLDEKKLPAFFYLERAELKAQLNQWQAALDDYEQYRHRSTDGRLLLGEAKAHYYLWKEYKTTDARSQAEDGLQAAHKWARKEGNLDIQVSALTYLGILAGENLHSDEDFKQAWDYFEQALKFKDSKDAQTNTPVVRPQTSAALYYNRATLLHKWGKMPQALHNLDKAAEYNPTDPIIANAQGLFNFEDGKMEEAENAWRRAAQLLPNENNLINLGMVLVRRRKIAEAKAKFKQALDVAQDKKGDIQNWLGVCELADGSFEAAVALFQEVVETDPHNESAWGNLGAVLFYLNHKNQAQDAFANATRNGAASGIVERIWAEAFLRLEGNPNIHTFAVESEMAKFNPDYEAAEYAAARWLGLAFAGKQREAYQAARQNQVQTTDVLSRFYWHNLEMMLVNLYREEVSPPQIDPQNAPKTEPEGNVVAKLNILLVYGDNDLLIVKDLYRQLKGDGFEPWMEEEDLMPGQTIKLALIKAVKDSDVVVLCLSKAATTQAGNFNRQLNWALDQAEEMPEDKNFLIPLLLDDCEIPQRLADKKPLHYQNGQNYQRLVSLLRNTAGNNQGSMIGGSTTSSQASSTLPGPNVTLGSNPKTPLLSTDDFNELARILLEIGSFQTNPSAFLKMAGFPLAFVYNTNLSGSVMAITNEVVTRVVTYRSLPEPPYTPGILALFEMIQKQGISLQDQQKIEEIIRRNQLLSMPQLIKTGTESGEMLQAIHTVGEWFTNANRFVRGYKALQSVCRVEAPDGSVGTGFLVGPDLVLTNYHVVSGNDTEIIPENELYQKAAALTFRFGYLANGNQSQPGYTVKSKATSTHPALQTYSEPAKLDFALLQLNEAVGTSDKFGVVALDPREIATPENALILQHPGGREMEFHPGIIKGYNYDPQNEGKSRIHYTTNTQGGSSGSPVFDKFWNVIGLHHSGSTYPKLNNPITRETNEGIPLKAIWPYIERYIKNKA